MFDMFEDISAESERSILNCDRALFCPYLCHFLFYMPLVLYLLPRRVASKTGNKLIYCITGRVLISDLLNFYWYVMRKKWQRMEVNLCPAINQEIKRLCFVDFTLILQHHKTLPPNHCLCAIRCMLPKNSEKSIKIQFVTENYLHIGKNRVPLTEYIKDFQEKNVIDKLGVWFWLTYSKSIKSCFFLSPSTKR